MIPYERYYRRMMISGLLLWVSPILIAYWLIKRTGWVKGLIVISIAIISFLIYRQFIK